MSVATLPPNLRDKLDVLARRLRRLRWLRGVGFTLLVLALTSGIALGLDGWLELPPMARIALASLLIVAVAATAWRKLIQPLRRPVTAAGLAAAVEDEYPRLSERLTSAVEVADSDATHGSPAFIRMLLRETDQKTRALDFARAAPPRTTGWVSAGAVAAVVLLIAPALFIPEYYLGLGRRLIMPWDRRPAVMPFNIEVSPGNIYAARGRPLTISVELKSKRADVKLPEVCTLVLTAEDGKPMRLRMPAGTGAHAFAFRMEELKGPITYYADAGQIQTDTYAILAIDPVELVGSPTATLTPPAYAQAAGVQSIEGPLDLNVLEYGKIAIDCKFDRPADSATLLFAPLAGKNESLQQRPLTLAADRRSGRIELPAVTSAKLRLELSAGHGVTTQFAEQTLTVTPDRPPEFRRAAGLPDQGAIRPTDSLGLDLAVADDLSVTAVEAEYRINGGPILREPLALSGLGSREAAGHVEFRLAGKAKDGDKLFLRLRARDNRFIPEAGLGPNLVTYPPGDRWSELRVSADADSARRQEVTARRDDIEKRLRELIAQVDRAVRKAYALHQNIEQGQAGANEQVQTVRDLTDQQAELTKKLSELAGDAAVAGLNPLAEVMQAVGEQEFRQANQAFREAGMATDKGRVPPLGRADDALTTARTKLEALLQENRDLADDRLNEATLNELAERERELADEAKKVVSPEERERLAKEQEQIAEELKKLTANDDKLRDALQAAQAEDARKLADEARELARAERDLDAKLIEAERRRNVAKLADLAKQQQQLAADARRLAQQTQQAARVSRTNPLDSQPAAKAGDELKSGNADSALQRQEESARELERVAGSLQRGIETAKDPREAAQQLSRLQETNRLRLDRPAEKALARHEQEAISKAVANLKVPEENAAGRRDRQQAAELAAEAARALNRDDPAGAEFRMGQVKEALDRLAKELPSVEDRKRRARDEVARLRQAQEEITKEAEKTAKANANAATDERAEVARKQADVAERLSKLDAPGQEARRDRATKAAARAEDDLQNAASPNVAASQADARRALERLAEALAGQTPADEKARELARQERDLAAAAAKAVGEPDAQRPLQRRQERVTQETQGLATKATEAPVRQGEAAQAAIQANAALRDKPDEAETERKMRAAADKLDALADQLAGGETDAQRADRLAKKQEENAKQPPANAIDARRQANQIASEAQQIRATDNAAAAKQKALDALQRLQRSPPGQPENSEAQQAAAQALRRLADDMTKKPAEANSTTRPDDLARQQRELARETDTAAKQPASSQSLQKLADRQQQLRQLADGLPSDQAPAAVQQARQEMQRAEQALARQDGPQAARQQRQAADALDKAARQIAENANAGRANTHLPDGMPTPGQVGQARDLAKRQRDLRDQVRQIAEGDRPSADERTAADQKQQDMAQKANDLARSLDQSASSMSDDRARQSARGAAASARQGEKSLQDAQSGDAGQAKQARKQAADALDRAAGQAEKAARAGDPGRPQPGLPQTGQQLQSAKGQMKQAQNQLGQNQSKQAEGSMQRAADALQQAAKQAGAAKGPRDGANQPAQVATQGKGTPTAADLPKELQKYAGKKWGELPGELRTRIVQDMKAQYGEDYGRVIKLYFEQIAENGAKNK